MLQKNVDSTYDRFRMRYIGTTDVTVANIGLYAGTYEVLPTFRGRLLWEERSRCLVFFRRVASSVIAGRAVSGSLRVSIPIETPLRSNNAVLIVNNNGVIRGEGMSIAKEKVTVALGNLNPSEITLNITESDSSQSLTQNSIYAWDGGAIGIDADFV